MFVGVTSARPDGATALAVALAARVSTTRPTLLADLNPHRPEVSVLLDVDCQTNAYHLAHRLRLGSLTAKDVAGAAVWREGLAIIPGITQPGQGAELSTSFVRELIRASSTDFEVLVADLGPLEASLPVDSDIGHVLWAVTPSPLGIAAFDRAWREIDADDVAWRGSLSPVLTRVAADSLEGTERYVAVEAGLDVVATVPSCPGIWQRMELRHSMRELVAPGGGRRFSQALGTDVVAFRRAIDELVVRLELTGVRAARAS